MSFIPAVRSFTGFNPAGENDGVRQGTDWSRAVVFTDVTTGALIDMSAFQTGFGGIVRGAFKDKTRATTYFSTAAGTLVLTWLDANTLQVKIPASASSALSIAVDPAFPERTIPNTARYSIEGVSGVTGLVERILEGRFEMDRETVLTST